MFFHMGFKCIQIFIFIFTVEAFILNILTTFCFILIFISIICDVNNFFFMKNLKYFFFFLLKFVLLKTEASDEEIFIVDFDKSIMQSLFKFDIFIKYLK